MPKLNIIAANDELDESFLETKRSMIPSPYLSPSPSPQPMDDDIDPEIDPDNMVIRGGAVTDDEDESNIDDARP